MPTNNASAKKRLVKKKSVKKKVVKRVAVKKKAAKRVVKKVSTKKRVAPKKKVTKRVAAKKKAQIKKAIKKAPSNPVGRPPKYKTPEEMQRVIDLYFLAIKANTAKEPELYLVGLSEAELELIKDIEGIIPTVSGLAYTLDLSTRALVDYKAKDEFLPTIKRARQRIEMSLEQRLGGSAPTGTIFNLKNNFGWKDKVETDITSGGKAIKNEWHMHPTTSHKKGD